MRKSLLLVLILQFLLFNSYSENQTNPCLDILKGTDNDSIKIVKCYDFIISQLYTNSEFAENLLPTMQNYLIDKKILSPYLNKRFYNIKAAIFSLQRRFDLAFTTYNKALAYGKATQDAIYDEVIYNNIALLYVKLSDFDSALLYFNKMLPVAKKINVRQYYIGLMNISDVYSAKENFKLALNYLNKCENYFLKEKDSMNIILYYNKLGLVYDRMQLSEMAIENFRKSEYFDKSYKEIDILPIIYNNIGKNYINLLNNDSALYYLQKSLEINKSANQYIEISTLINIGNIYIETKNYKKALEYYLKANNMPQEMILPLEKTALITNLGICYFYQNQFANSYEFLLKGLQLSKDIDLKEFQLNALSKLCSIDSLRKDYKSYSKHLAEYYELKMYLNSTNLRNFANELEVKYGLEKSKMLTKQLQTENKLKKQEIKDRNLLIIIIFIILIFIIPLLLINLKKQRSLKILNQNLHIQDVEIIEKSKKLEELNHILEVQKQELNESLIAKDRLFSIISHDLKSPFNSLLGFLAILEDKTIWISENEKDEIIHKLNENAKNTYQMLTNLLNWALSQKGKLNNIPNEFDLDNTLKRISQTYKPMLENKNQIFLINNEINKILLDENLLNTIIVNLVSNSIKFTPRGGTIKIKTTIIDNNLQLCVEDNGIGISAEKQINLFSKISIDKTYGTENERGTGLGLVVCKEFADILGATFLYHPIETGGSEFCLKVPLQESKEIN